MVVEVEGFFGVYLLYSVNPKFRGRTYVGFTVNPERRVRQHNAGRKRGGAWRTSGRGPWDMVLIVHGFPTDIAALRFEWAWQHPHRSRRLCHVTRRRRSESSLVFHVRVLAEMVRTLPWQRLPLTIRWLKQDYRMDFPPGLQPPLHMPIAFGPVRARTAHIQLEAIAKKNPPSQPCSICQKPFEDEEDVITCFQPACLLSYHIICLAKEFLHNEPDQLLPNEGLCPSCKTSVLWGDLVRYKNGCYGDLEEMGASAQVHWTDDLQL